MEVCPRCGGLKLEKEQVLNALSRRDNETYICSDCGTAEAIFDYGMSTMPRTPVTEYMIEEEQSWLRKERV